MLYEFHRQQNGKKPGTIHATYLLAGVKNVPKASISQVEHGEGEDDYMQSSPFMGSSMPQADDAVGPRTLTITLTREEDLAGIVVRLGIS